MKIFHDNCKAFTTSTLDRVETKKSVQSGKTKS